MTGETVTFELGDIRGAHHALGLAETPIKIHVRDNGPLLLLSTPLHFAAIIHVLLVLLFAF